MTNEEDPGGREQTKVAGAFLSPTGTFPAELHTLTEEEADEATAGAEPAAREVSPVTLFWATGLAVAIWSVGVIVVAILIAAVLALGGFGRPDDTGKTLLGYVDLLVLIPAALVGIRAERIWGAVPFVIVLAVAAVIALAATFATEAVPFVFGISIALAVVWWLVRGRR